jgi:hypothetical protein
MTTLQKRLKIIYLLVLELYQGQKDLHIVLYRLEELADRIDENHPQAEKALCFYEDNIISILSEGKTVAELN